VIYAGYDEDKGDDDIVCLALNVFWEPLEITLPDLPEGRSWHLVVSTGGEERGMDWKKVTMRPRSVAIFSAETFRHS
jgi:glycogen operon protein